MSRPPKITPTVTPPAPGLKVWAYVCGCVERDRRGGPLVEQCTGVKCERRLAPAGATRHVARPRRR